jgi:anthranilate/para-aminobenzoate synthase component II
MKVVAVTQRIDVLSDRAEIRDSLDSRLVSLFLELGKLAIPVPSGLCKASGDEGWDFRDLDFWLAAVRPTSVVLSGGNDLGEVPHRDNLELRLLDYAKFHRLPVLGICRGMQVMADWAGVKLRPVRGHVRTRHRILGEISGEVNSYHSFSINSCPPEFDTLARSEDGEIEAIRHRFLRWEAWMWHPEREDLFIQRDLVRIESLFSS